MIFNGNTSRYINPYTDFGFKRIFEIAEIAKYSKEERFAYEEILKIYRDNKNVVDTALDTGYERGKSEGRAEGTIAIVRNLKSMGMTAEQISQATGLGIEEIERL